MTHREHLLIASIVSLTAGVFLGYFHGVVRTVHVVESAAPSAKSQTFKYCISWNGEKCTPDVERELVGE